MPETETCFRHGLGLEQEVAPVLDAEGRPATLLARP
jgi:hypothetical protein